MPTPTDRFELDTFDPGESWDHTDTVQFLDESAIEVDTINNRPTDGSYDGELFFATDQRILYQWDAGGSSWDVELGLGVDGTPVPGTSHFEALEANSVSGDVVGRPEAIDNLEGNVYLEPEGTDPSTVLENDGDMVFIHE